MTLAIILAEAGSQSEKVLIVTLIVTTLASFGASVLTFIKGRSDRDQARKDKAADAVLAAEEREQVRLDAAHAAKLVLDKLHAQELSIKISAAAREARIRADIAENTKMNVEALTAANGVNEKIEKFTAAVAQGSTPVTIINNTNGEPTA